MLEIKRFTDFIIIARTILERLHPRIHLDFVIGLYVKEFVYGGRIKLETIGLVQFPVDLNTTLLKGNDAKRWNDLTNLR